LSRSSFLFSRVSRYTSVSSTKLHGSVLGLETTVRRVNQVPSGTGARESSLNTSRTGHHRAAHPLPNRRLPGVTTLPVNPRDRHAARPVRHQRPVVVHAAVDPQQQIRSVAASGGGFRPPPGQARGPAVVKCILRTCRRRDVSGRNKPHKSGVEFSDSCLPDAAG
jgi:hypothetical protein